MPTTLKRKKTTRTKKNNRKSVSLGRAYDDVRAKGILLKDGITYNRQKPITKMLKGKEITISFAFNRIVKGFYGIIEAENLQPSHSTGVQNPFHFLPEAQPRNRSTSQSGRETPQLIARNLRPAEIIEGANAYTGAPIANLRGEVIQGNGRADTLKIYYSLEPNGEIYKNYFFDGCNANFLGFSARTIKSELAKFKKPILGRFCDVSDEEFIQLGQFQAKDLEAVSSESSDTKARVNRISETDLAKMIDALLRYDKGDDSLTEIIRNSNALAYFVKAKVLRADELEKYTKNGQANAQGTEFVRQFLLQFLFEQGKDTKTSQKFENLPHHTQKGVEKSLLYVLKVHCYADCDDTDHSITKEVSNAIGAAYDFLQQSTFNFPAWVKQTPVFEPSPKDRFSPLELELAKVFSEGKTQKDIVDKFKKYAYYATDRPATMLEKEEKALSKNEALQKAFSISLSGLGCTSSCACQKKKVLNGCECDDFSTSEPKKAEKKEPYEMTFNAYMHLDNGYKKDFQRFINVEKEVEKERIFDKEKRAKAISWREKQYKILLNTTRELLRERHKYEVEKALSEGKTVPKEVLKDYLDLQQKATSEPKKEVDKEVILTVKLPVSINTFKEHGNSVLWDKQKLKTISDTEFITLWKYTIAANTMLSDSIFSKTKNGDRHVLSQYGKKELVNAANEEFVRRGLDKKYTLFTEKKNVKIPTSASKPKGQFYITNRGSNNAYYAIRVYRNGKSMGYYDAELYILKTKPEFYVLSFLKDILENFDAETAYQKTRRFKLDRKRKVEKYDAYAKYEATIVEKIDEKITSEKPLSEFQNATSQPKKETEDFELQLAIAKMKMLKLKAKALQMNELDGLLYGLEGIYDDSELNGFHLDGLDGMDVYDIVNEKILEVIEKGEDLAWRKTWKIKERNGAAANYDTKRAYTGSNFFLLNFVLPILGVDYKYPYFLTFKQIQKRKGTLKKGSKSYPIFYYNIVRKYKGKNISEAQYYALKAQGIKDFKEVRFLKYYNVFNIDSIEGIDFDLSDLEEYERVNFAYEPIETAEKIYYNMPNKPRLKLGTKASYVYGGLEEYVKMPPVVEFGTPQEFYSVFYHELIHSTKHSTRLNDTSRGGKVKGDKAYALEELVAELGACYLCAESGILYHTIDNSAAYLKSWNKKLTESIKEDKTFFLKAAAKAQKAADYILDYDSNGIPAYQRNSYYEPIPLVPITDKIPSKTTENDEDDFQLQLAISKMKMLKTKAKALQL